MFREIHNDYLVSARLPSALVAHAKEVAKLQGMNLSTFLRQAVKRNIQSYQLNERNICANFK